MKKDKQRMIKLSVSLRVIWHISMFELHEWMNEKETELERCLCKTMARVEWIT